MIRSLYLLLCNTPCFLFLLLIALNLNLRDLQKSVQIVHRVPGTLPSISLIVTSYITHHPTQKIYIGMMLLTRGQTSVTVFLINSYRCKFK